MIKDFEDYKLAHYFLYSRELKRWETEKIYTNLFLTDWSELMKLVDEIEFLETDYGHYEVRMHLDKTIIVDDHFNEFITADGGNRQENTYAACVEYIKWFKKMKEDGYVD